jgi:uncharacterized protein (TIGR02271 family)
MTEFTEAYDYHGRTLLDRNGEKVGKIEEVYADQESGQPEWALLHTGLLGTKKNFVPLRGATASGEDVQVGIDKQAIKDSPGVEADGELSEPEERTLFEHYGIPYTTEGSTTAQGVADTGAATSGDIGSAGAVGSDVSGPNTDDAMTRSEEEVRVGTRTREAGRVRLRKYVVTENVQQTVPVQREEVRVEREPITESNIDQATSGPEISEEEHEVVLHAEEPVVEKRAVPKERVRLGTDAVTDEEQISEEVRKERIEVEEE